MFSWFGCGKSEQVIDGDGKANKPAYAHISQDDAKLMMQDDDGHVIADESIVSYSSKVKYQDSDHEEMDGAGYDVIITFTGKKTGETRVIIE